TEFDPQIAAVDPPGLLQALPQRQDATRRFRIVRGGGHQHAEALNVLILLRPGCQRPRGRRAPDERDEFAPPHSITSSARASSDGGTSRPNALAVIILITSSNLLARRTGISPGFSPLSTRPV